MTHTFDNVQCVLLDIDGTLVDSNEAHVSAWDEAFKRGGHAVDRSLIRQQIGKGADQLIPSLRPELDEATRESIAKEHDEIFRSCYLPDVRPFDRATDLVAALHRRGLKVVLASSANRLEVDHYIDLLNIKDLLTASTCADDVQNSKPAGDIFASALKKIDGATPDRALVIGDTPYDVIAATKCKIGTLAVLSGGFSEDDLRRAGAHEVYRGVSGIVDEIESE